MVREVCEGLTFFFVSAKIIKKAKKKDVSCRQARKTPSSIFNKILSEKTEKVK